MAYSHSHSKRHAPNGPCSAVSAIPNCRRAHVVFGRCSREQSEGIRAEKGFPFSILERNKGTRRRCRPRGLVISRHHRCAKKQCFATSPHTQTTHVRPLEPVQVETTAGARAFFCAFFPAAKRAAALCAARAFICVICAPMKAPGLLPSAQLFLG